MQYQNVHDGCKGMVAGAKDIDQYISMIEAKLETLRHWREKGVYFIAFSSFADRAYFGTDDPAVAKELGFVGIGTEEGGGR